MLSHPSEIQATHNYFIWLVALLAVHESFSVIYTVEGALLEACCGFSILTPSMCMLLATP